MMIHLQTRNSSLNTSTKKHFIGASIILLKLWSQDRGRWAPSSMMTSSNGNIFRVTSPDAYSLLWKFAWSSHHCCWLSLNHDMSYSWEMCYSIIMPSWHENAFPHKGTVMRSFNVFAWKFVEQVVDLSVIWDAIAFTWRHCNHIGHLPLVHSQCSLWEA